MSRVQTISDMIFERIQNPDVEIQVQTPQNACPQCGTEFFQLREGNTIECQLCQAKGSLHSSQGSFKISWSPEGQKNRWSPEAMAEHFSEWVLRTGPVYQNLREEIMSRLEKYRQIRITPK